VKDAPEQKESDVSAMMDLFRSEVKRHALTLHDGLQALATNPKSLDRLQGMIPAIQAIKGGAQIIDLEEAVAVAQAMKSVFVAAEKGEFKLDEAGVHRLFKGLEILDHISEAPKEGEPAWIDTNAQEVNAWVNGIVSSSVVVPSNECSDPQSVTVHESEPVAFSSSFKDETSSSAEEGPHEEAEGLLDPAMCDLFRSETQNYVAILNDGLLALEQNPASADQLEAMMRAAHSIKGAGRIVGLDAAVHMAHAMEDTFVAAQKGLISLDSGMIDILFQGVDMLNRISEHAGEGGSAWLSENRNEIETVREKIRGIVTQEMGGTSQAPGPETSPRENEEPLETVHEETHGDAPDSASQQTHETFAADPAMLDLFQAEVETHVAVLNDGLLALENNPGATDQLEALMRAAHSIKGGARIVGLDAAVKVAHAMEDCFVAAQKGVVSLGSEQIDILLRIVDILIQHCRIHP
jgi:two-component system sensor histidine kinase and response regulator WspE